MNLIYEKGRVRVYYMPTDKFKTETLSISFCAPLTRERAYRNALIPMILNRGSKQYPTTGAMTKYLMGLYGAGFGVDLDKRGEIQLLQFQSDYIAPAYAQNCPNIARKVSEFLVDVITRPRVSASGGFLPDYFEQERTNTDQFIRSEINDKQSYAMRRCVETMCHGEPFGVSEIGSLGDGNTLTPESLYEDYQNHFLQDMAVRIFCCAEKEPTALIEALETNGVLTSGRAPMPLNMGYKAVTNCSFREVTERADVLQGKLNMGFRTNTEPDSVDFPALYVMSAIFGGGPQSKLFTNVREKHSLAYYASSRLERYKGLMYVASGIDIANKDRAQALILAQLEDVQRGKITDAELEGAKAMLMHSLRSLSDTQFSLMNYYIGQSFLNRITEIETYMEQIQSVTKEDVIRVAQRIVPDTVYFLTGKEEAKHG
ncbi:MAG: insulinase family protein [Clostridia bacterium]|nr:insulinase family protein [Clostridia bacterium]